MPKVSVLIPCYNAVHFIGEAIDSILAQTLGDFELIVVDDGSVDDTAALIARYADARVRLVRLPENRGVAAARNEAIRHGTGEYFAFLDADDICGPNRLEIQARFLDTHPDIDVVGSAYRSLGKLKVWKAPAAHGTVAGEAFFKLPLRMSTVMLRKSALRGGRIFMNPAFLVSEDHDFVDQLLAAGSRFANLPQALVDYRTHAHNTSNAFAARGIGFADTVRHRAILRLLPDSTHEELALHDAIATRSPDLHAKDAPRVAAWLEKLYTAASLRQGEDARDFLRALARQWDQVCALFAREGFVTAVRCYYSRPLFYRAGGLAGQAAFIARCLKKRRR